MTTTEHSSAAPERRRIDFDSPHALHGELSNAYVLPTELRYMQRNYATSEHLYQALKFLYVGASPATRAYAERVRQARTSYAAEILADQQPAAHGAEWRLALNADIEHARLAGVRSDPSWVRVLRERMRMVLALKFAQSAPARDALVSTGNALLAYHTDRNTFWGDGGDERRGGANVLGELLMAERAKHLRLLASLRSPPSKLGFAEFEDALPVGSDARWLPRRGRRVYRVYAVTLASADDFSGHLWAVQAAGTSRPNHYWFLVTDWRECLCCVTWRLLLKERPALLTLVEMYTTNTPLLDIVDLLDTAHENVRVAAAAGDAPGRESHDDENNFVNEAAFNEEVEREFKAAFTRLGCWESTDVAQPAKKRARTSDAEANATDPAE